MLLPSLLLVILLSGISGEEKDTPREAGYDSYADSTAYTDKWQLNTFPPTPECGGLVRPLLAGVLIGAVVKIPLLLLGKLILLKATVPLAVAGALVPLGLLSIYRASQQGSSSGGNSTSRLLPHGCLQAAACGMGSVAPKGAIGATSWLLKTIADAGDAGWDATVDVSSYREAYIKGAASKVCTEYPCPYI